MGTFGVEQVYSTVLAVSSIENTLIFPQVWLPFVRTVLPQWLLKKA